MGPTNRLGGWAACAIAVGCVAAATLFAFDRSRAQPGTAPRAPGAAPEPSPEQVRSARAVLERKREKLATQGPKAMDEPQLAAEFFLEQRLLPGQTRLPIEHLREVYDELRSREQRTAPPPEAAGPGGIFGWTWLGPGNIGGRTRALVIDPTNPDRMLAAGVAGGIWTTADGGQNWAPADDFMLNLAVCSLAMDPTNPNVLYAGTGEGWFFSDIFVEGLGIFKSTDGGATWNQLPSTVAGVPEGSFSYVNDLVISPNDPQRVYAGTRTGVWRSSNGGQNWSVVLSNPDYLASTPATKGCAVGCTDLAVRGDTSPDVLFAAFGSDKADGLYRSLNGGNTWQTYVVPANQGRMSIALAPSDNDVMYLLMADNGSVGGLGQLVNVFRSLDGGNTFTGQVDFSSLTGPWLLSNLSLATGCLQGGVYSQGWYDNAIAVDPIDPNVVWVGGVDIFRSDNGGVSWGIPGYWFFYLVEPNPPYQIHPDHHRIVFHPGFDGNLNQTMYVANDGGLFRTNNARAATSQEDCPLPPDQPLPQIVWERLNNGYGVTQFYHGDSAVDADVFIGGAQDNGTCRVQSAGASDAWKMIFGGDGGYVAIDPSNSQTVYIEYHAFPTIQKSTDGGDTFVPAVNGITDTDGIFITPFAMDPSNPNVLWTGGRRPWRTLDGAASWKLAGPNLPLPDSISAIGIAPSNGNVVYLGFTNGYVTRTTNGLAVSPTWTTLTNGLSGGWVSSVAVDPVDPNVAYLTSSSYGVPHVMKTTNGGQNWTSIDGLGAAGVPDIPAHWIAVRPCRPEHLFVGSELGVFASEDAGATWSPSNAGLAHTVVEALDFQDDDTLVAFTHGRGAFRTALQACPGGAQVEDLRKYRPTGQAGHQ